MGVGSGMFQNATYLSEVEFMFMLSPCPINGYKPYVVQYCTDSDGRILGILFG
jgi:hypothetical protein